MKTLIIYFSASGATKHKAEKLAVKMNADLFEITPKIKYSKEDLNWRNENSRSSIEMKDLSSRPEIVKKPLDITQYSDIYLGFPIWWYTAPTIINTFLENYDLSKVTIHLFKTSGSSSIDKAYEDLKKQYPKLNFVL